MVSRPPTCCHGDAVQPRCPQLRLFTTAHGCHHVHLATSCGGPRAHRCASSTVCSEDSLTGVPSSAGEEGGADCGQHEEVCSATVIDPLSCHSGGEVPECGAFPPSPPHIFPACTVKTAEPRIDSNSTVISEFLIPIAHCTLRSHTR